MFYTNYLQTIIQYDGISIIIAFIIYKYSINMLYQFNKSNLNATFSNNATDWPTSYACTDFNYKFLPFNFTPYILAFFRSSRSRSRTFDAINLLIARGNPNGGPGPPETKTMPNAVFRRDATGCVPQPAPDARAFLRELCGARGDGRSFCVCWMGDFPLVRTNSFIPFPFLMPTVLRTNRRIRASRRRGVATAASFMSLLLCVHRSSVFAIRNVFMLLCLI